MTTKTSSSDESAKTFFIYFSLVLTIILTMGMFFLHQEVLDHKEDVRTHTNQTLLLEDNLYEHMEAMKKAVILIENEMKLLDQINRSTYFNNN